MKLKKVSLILATLIMTFSISTPIVALENEKEESQKYYLKTMNGERLTEEEYSNLSKIYSHATIMTLDPESLNSFKNLNDLTKEDYVEYFEVTTLYNNLIPVSKTEKKISKKDYEAVDVRKVEAINQLSSLLKSSAYHETTYKKITLTLAYPSVGISRKSVTIRNEWKIIPSVKKFDILAIGFEQNFGTLSTTRSGYQKYDGILINYSSSSSNFKPSSSFLGIFKSGIALSQNLVDSTVSTLENSLTVTFTTGSAPTVRATYQHAICNGITLSNSHDWLYSSDGMGGIIKFSSTNIRNCYDNTSGLVASFPY